MQRHSRIARSSVRMHERIGDIRAALADGYQADDFPVIEAACNDLVGELAEVEDIELDILAARRTLTVGRREVFDERFSARERDVERLLSEKSARCGSGGEKKPTGSERRAVESEMLTA